MTKNPLTILAGVLVLHACFTQARELPGIPAEQLNRNYQLVGKLHAPLGTPITVEGVVVEGQLKGYEGGPNLRVQRIGGHALQQDIQIRLEPYFHKWGEKISIDEGPSLPELEMGKTYEMEGYETGGYVGVPARAYKKAGLMLQTTGHYFRMDFIVYKARRIDPISFQPADFEGQMALLQGTAKSIDHKAYMKGNDWSVNVDARTTWPADIEGKIVEAYGMYNPTAEKNVFDLVGGKCHLVLLEDQLERKVELRGQARSLNGVWWFHYRGTDLYVENMESLPGWTTECHWRPMIIRGFLEKATLPRLDQISLKSDRDLAEYFIVRKPEWEPIDALLNVERPFTDSE